MLWPQIHGEPRHSQLLLAGGVELGKLGDGGHLTEQPQSIKTPLLSRAMQTTARNRPTYFRNSGPLIWRQPVFSAIDVRTVVGRSAPASVAVIRSPRRQRQAASAVRSAQALSRF